MIERSELTRSFPVRGGWDGWAFNLLFACFIISGCLSLSCAFVAIASMRPFLSRIYWSFASKAAFIPGNRIYSAGGRPNVIR